MASQALVVGIIVCWSVAVGGAGCNTAIKGVIDPVGVEILSSWAISLYIKEIGQFDVADDGEAIGAVYVASDRCVDDEGLAVSLGEVEGTHSKEHSVDVLVSVSDGREEIGGDCGVGGEAHPA